MYFKFFIPGFIHDKFMISISDDVRVERLVSHVEQELLTLLWHLSSPPLLVECKLLDLKFSVQCLVDRCLLFCYFLFAIALSVLLRFTDYHYSFGIFNLFLH